MRHLTLLISIFISSLTWANTHEDTQKPVLKAGYLSLDWSPLSSINNKNEVVGLLPDFMKIIARNLGYSVENIVYDTPEKLLRSLADNELDIAMGVSKSIEREKTFAFSKALLAFPYAMISYSSSNILLNYDNKIITIEENSAVNRFIPQLGKSINVLRMPNSKMALNAVKTGAADAYIGNSIILDKLLSNNNASVPLEVTTIEQMPLEQIHIASAKGNSALIKQLDVAISALSKTETNWLYEKWLTNDQIALLENPTSAKLTFNEKTVLKSLTTLKIGYQFDNHCPKEDDVLYLQVEGIAKRIKDSLGVNYQFIHINNYSQAKEMLAQGEIDIVGAVASSPIRKKELLFSMPYSQEGWVIVNKISKQNSHRITHKNSIGVLESAFVKSLTNNLYPRNKTISFSSNNEMLSALMNDQLDYAVISLSQAHLLLQNAFLGQLKVVPSKLDNHQRSIKFAVNHDNFPLRNIINKVILTLPQENLYNNLREWQSITIKSDVNYNQMIGWALTVAIVITSIIAVIIYWNRRLRREITQRKNAEQKLTYLTNNFDGILIQHLQKSANPFDIEFLFISEKINQFIDYNASKLYEEPALLINILQQREDFKTLYLAMKQAVSVGYWSTNLQIHSHTFKPRWIELRCQISEVENGWQWNTIILDITQTKEQQVALMKANEQSLAATESKSRFLAMMSHEIRTPISGILSLLELMEPYAKATELRQIHHNLSQSGRNLLNIVNDVLDFSKIEAGKLSINPSKHSISDIIHELVQPHSIHAQQKEITLTLWLDPAIAHYLCFDEVRLTQILNNLINNAIKFTVKGNIHLAIDMIQESASHQTLTFSITDTGIGIKQEDLVRLFQPFVQVEQSSNRRFSGTGLGLSICYQLAQLMKGEIVAKSDINIGTTFSVTIPFPIIEKKMITPLYKHCGLIGGIYDQYLDQYLDAWQCSSCQIMESNKAKLLTIILTKKINTIIVRDSWLIEHGINEEWFITNLPSINVITIISPDHFLTQNTNDSYSVSLSPLLPDVLYRLLAKQTNRNSTFPELNLKEKSTLTYEQAIAQGRYILVAEDHPINQQILKQQLELLNYAVDIVDNGQKALDALSNNSYDLLLTDCHMPELDGFELVKAIRKKEQIINAKPLPILALTADALSNEEFFKEIGFNAYLIKPITLDELNAVLSQWLPSINSDNVTLKDVHIVTDNLDNKNTMDLIDINELIDIFGDRETTYILLEQYLTSCSQDQYELSAAINAKNIELVSLIIHRIKGAARVMTFHQLDAFCIDVEKDIQQHNIDTLQHHYASLTVLIKQLNQQFTNLKAH
ncbi:MULTISPECIES: transporter substrate-binding domain-containing protein [unclassified Photobacterium]|uniref:transporter substrate-binding domain-containing protein n=1 Tax=unclassified Photobacterium TaxID=2628852 RepID=UPI001EDCEB08|nr:MULTISPECIES: transporter substrate-binding domain-containing protein [unclassified Photobacterium]MCG3864705.1 transporter substrate-binding domain-containing protein [Photobacterium sp. Ph6]MCG3876829.1 transporter substrate-binding domain-containing protein [Photobacterium sp. Ph5]